MRRFLSLVFCLTAFVGGVCAPSLRAEIIISEIMYNPQGTDLAAPIYREWAELYNTGDSAVNLGGWQFGDSHDNQWATAFPAGTILQPHQALVVTGDTSSFDLEWGAGINRVQVGSFPTLANTPAPVDETPAIRDNTGVIRDALAYDDDLGWPHNNGSDGNSIFLLPQALNSTANNIGTNWKPAMRGVYGATFKSADGENHGSPGFVDTVPQAPFTPSPDAAWSMVYMPDTQNYVKSAIENPNLVQQTTWIRDHREEFNIKAVIQGGDIVNKNDNVPTTTELPSTQQWQNAKAGMAVLNGYVPYIMAAGNHDFGFTNADNRNTMINNYFKASDNPLTDPAQGGILQGYKTAGDISNAYYAFTAPDGRKMLIFSLEWEPRPLIVQWANEIAALPQYADYTAVLLTHNYLQGNNTRSTTTNVAGDAAGQDLWEQLVSQHENFEMVFNGHFGGDGAGVLRSTGVAGNQVQQMFLDSQFETYGGNGWVRVVEFLQDGKTVRVRTYSTLHDLERTGPDYSFEFTLDALPIVPGDYNRNGLVDQSDYVVWRNSVGSVGEFAADGNGDGVVDQLDYNYWRQRFGNQSGAGASESLAAVPEPSSLVMLLIAASAAVTRRRKR